MAKDAVATMGGLLPEDAGGRDAVHVAVFSARSAVVLYPGQHIGLVSYGERDSEVGAVGLPGSTVAIVDPFLLHAVMPGERFWAYLYPRTITSLSHRWGHPAFKDVAEVYSAPAAKLVSEKWIRDYFGYDEEFSYDYLLRVLSEIADGTHRDDDLRIDGAEASGTIPSDFWGHAEIVLGRPIKGENPTFFSCAC